jgi:hypothetical protein
MPVHDDAVAAAISAAGEGPKRPAGLGPSLDISLHYQ